MTNNEKLNSITGETDTPEISAVKMLLARIEEDAEHGDYDGNRETYLGPVSYTHLTLPTTPYV